MEQPMCENSDIQNDKKTNKLPSLTHSLGNDDGLGVPVAHQRQSHVADDRVPVAPRQSSYNQHRATTAHLGAPPQIPHNFEKTCCIGLANLLTLMRCSKRHILEKRTTPKWIRDQNKPMETFKRNCRKAPVMGHMPLTLHQELNCGLMMLEASLKDVFMELETCPPIIGLVWNN
ncbi:hypothetical protein D0Y65_001427 [Glycine soja]|uniref:Uncharacterized protein n=2 Tax=Glycine subgen. Soja TaxID=1462606 RepID=A0A0R0LA67_SOYBN|nr:hypothetical protein JHK87_001653 [Glycine soja]RZC29819.1 hypothetical protein D0Y65_001427 [Glycine soja]